MPQCLFNRCRRELLDLHIQGYCDAVCLVAAQRDARSLEHKKLCKFRGCRVVLGEQHEDGYCGVTCKMADKRVKRNGPIKRERKIVFSPCEGCGIDIMGTGKTRYCSIECRDKYLGERLRPLSPVVTRVVMVSTPTDTSYPCIGCVHNRVNQYSDSGYECEAGLYRKCKPYFERLHYRRAQ